MKPHVCPKCSGEGKLMGIRVAVDDTMPDDAMALVDPETGKELIRMINVGRPEPTEEDS